MRPIINFVFILVLSVSARAELWPSGALFSPEAGLPPAEAGRLELSAAGCQLKNAIWNESCSEFGLSLGLGRGLGISMSSGMRNVKGYGAFQNGLEDMRMGLSFWPEVLPSFKLGLNGNFIIPTGFRKQESYYNPETDTSALMPAFSLKQNAGEMFVGAVWEISPAADVNAFAGYFSTSDKIEQAFRWGLGARIAPLGRRLPLELGYCQSFVRTGSFPNTEILRAALNVPVFAGLSVAPGLWANLEAEPLYGASLGLRFSAPVPGAALLKKHEAEVAAEPVKINGTILVPPPLTDLSLADRNELWQSIRDGLGKSYQEVISLASLDVPGLPFDDRTSESLRNSVRGIAAAYPHADWLLIARVEHEGVSRGESREIPMVVSQKGWTAECRLAVRLVNLHELAAGPVQTIDARAMRRERPLLSMMSSGDADVLSFAESRALTFQAYREAGKEIARGVTHE